MLCVTESISSRCTTRNTPLFRYPTVGPELTLVHEFVQRDGLPLPENQELTVFIEPRIDSSFPDLVAVYWDKNVVISWRDERQAMTRNDIRVLQYLYTSGECIAGDLAEIFGSTIKASLKRLSAAGMLARCDDLVVPYPLSRTFAIERLIAVEAKISNWQGGLMQAIKNTWFASESYLLMPNIPSSKRLKENANALGIGLVALDLPIDYSEPMARKEALPQSHGAWVFNEWLLSLVHQDAHQ